MVERYHTVIVGGGQAGLALSHCLQEEGCEHILLEAAEQPAEAWRNHRWDSFTLVTPNFHLRLPEAAYQGPDPNGYLLRDEVVAYLEDYARPCPVQYGRRVTAVEPQPDGAGYRVQTPQGTIASDNVVIATGAFQKPKVPPFSRNIPSAVAQIPSDQYRNPDSLPQGAVLVVGTGQSGCQIAEELYQSGRRVFLSVGRAGRAPRRYRGRDVVWWLDHTGFFDRTVDTLTSPQERYRPIPHVSGKDGGHDINLHQFARDGVVLLGHVQGAQGTAISLASDLRANLAMADQFEANLLKGIDEWIAAAGLDAPTEERPILRDGYAAEEFDRLDLRPAGITSIIWAGGYGFDYSLVRLPLLDETGYPVHRRGVTAYPGLYFLGLLFQYKFKSSVFAGVGEDAEYLAEQICTRL